MEMQDVVSILELLASGVDPTTREPIPQPTFQSPDVIRALFTAANTLKAPPPAAVAPARARPSASFRPWTPEEDARLSAEYDDALPLAEIARRHERTRNAINARLAHLGRIDPTTVRWRSRG